jgi:hypothetical protein
MMANSLQRASQGIRPGAGPDFDPTAQRVSTAHHLHPRWETTGTASLWALGDTADGLMQAVAGNFLITMMNIASVFYRADREDTT